MNKNKERYLIGVELIPTRDTFEQNSVIDIEMRLNNILNESRQTPNAQALRCYCEKNSMKLRGFINNNMLKLRIGTVRFDPISNRPSVIFSNIDQRNKSNVRIVLYPEQRGRIDELKLGEATHNMIVRFESSHRNAFIPVIMHPYSPNFYQIASKEIYALLYIEALIVDASMCHFVGVSHAAEHHDEKIEISRDKVEFIKDIASNGENNTLNRLSKGGKTLVEYVASQITTDTPYISFLSIFTLASVDLYKRNANEVIHDVYFDDYCIIWEEFMLWYYKKHKHTLNKVSLTERDIENVFIRNKYKKQIDYSDALNKIKDILKKEQYTGEGLGKKNLYAFVILKNIPPREEERKIVESLFSLKIHQAKWTIIHWNRLKDFQSIKEYIIVVPYIIE